MSCKIEDTYLEQYKRNENKRKILSEEFINNLYNYKNTSSMYKKDESMNLFEDKKVIFDKKQKNNYKMLSLFSGAGGVDIGFIQGGFDVVFANDFNKDACESYKKNIGDHIYHGDIKNITADVLPKCEIDVLFGGFPCQGFSINNSNRSIDDSRNYLYLEMMRIIKLTNPKIIVGENVRGLLNLADGIFIKKIVKDLETIGYTVQYKLLKCVNYGVPQNRERVIIIANRIGIKNIFPTITHSVENCMTLKDALGFLEDIDPIKNVNSYNNTINVNGKDLKFHYYKEANEKYLLKRKHTVDKNIIKSFLQSFISKENYDYVNTEFKKIHNCSIDNYINSKKSTPNMKQWITLKNILNLPDTYDKEMLDCEIKIDVFDQHTRYTPCHLPSHTIIADIVLIHYKHTDRTYSLLEASILQTFPIDYDYVGGITSIARQIGNAVPPLFAYHISLGIEKMLNQYYKK